ncbi:MAG: type II toxin-antitoxin system VapC family toxin [bacterium]
MIILDTCTLLWLVADHKRLSTKAKSSIMQNAGSIFVSSISAFEIAIKSRNGKLKLPMPIYKWFFEALKFHGIHEIPINSDIAINSACLPQLHNDPCDRIIIASAIQSSMVIITCDKLISQYKQIKVIW